MDTGAFIFSFTLLFLAEMGDKSQLIVMTLAHRYRALPVIAGSFVAFLLLDLLAVLVGDGLAELLPRQWILSAAGGLFLVFAWKSWNDAGDETVKIDDVRHREAFFTSFLLIFLAELGDKTQLTMIALAAESGALWSVFVGGTLALWFVSLIGIFVGRTFLRQVPKLWVHRAAALLFLGFGLLALVAVFQR